MTNVRVGTRELKAKLSEYLRRVKAGETVIVTEHGKTIGQIVPIKPGIEDRLQSMITAGLVEWNGQKPPAYQPGVQNHSDHLLSDLVIEDRE